MRRDKTVYALALCLLVSCGGSTKDTTSTSETDSLSFVEVHGEVGVLPHLEYRVAEGYGILPLQIRCPR